MLIPGDMFRFSNQLDETLLVISCDRKNGRVTVLDISSDTTVLFTYTIYDRSGAQWGVVWFVSAKKCYGYTDCNQVTSDQFVA